MQERMHRAYIINQETQPGQTVYETRHRRGIITYLRSNSISLTEIHLRLASFEAIIPMLSTYDKLPVFQAVKHRLQFSPGILRLFCEVGCRRISGNHSSKHRVLPSGVPSRVIVCAVPNRCNVARLVSVLV